MSDPSDHIPPPDPFPEPVPANSILAAGDGPPREPRARLIVVGSVCHQLPHADATAPAQLAHVRQLTSSEQPVRRRMTVGDRWEPLYRGWLEACSAVVIHNHEGEQLQRIPSEAERAATAAKVVQIGFSVEGPHDDPDLLCLPGESQGPFSPADLRRVFIRCKQGQAVVTVSVYPE